MKLSLLLIKISIVITILTNLAGCTSTTDIKESSELNPKVVTTSQSEGGLTSKNESRPVETNKIIEATVHFLDTGNSDSILIRQGDKSILIDGADADDGSGIVSYLKNAGVKTIDFMINTHPDADHVGGLAEIMTSFKIGRLYVSNGDANTKTYRNFIETAANLGLSPEVPLEASKIDITSNSSITFFNIKAIGKNNEVSLIILFENGMDRFLFTGDAGMDQEKKYLASLPDIDVLKVGHHGSNSSTSEELLKQTTPEYGVITVGADNTYGHPHKEVIKRLDDYKVNVYRTDLQGNIVFQSNGNGVSVPVTGKNSNAITTSKSTAIPAATTKQQTTTKAVNNAKTIITPSGKEIPYNYKFSKCDEVRLYFPDGFSKADYPELYAANPARDGDKDGWACE